MMIDDYPETQPPFGDYADRIHELVDGDGAAEILTLRAAEQGAYRLYLRQSVVKAVQNGQIEPIPEEVGLKSYYLKRDVYDMPIRPRRARASHTPAQIRKRVEQLNKEIIELREAQQRDPGSKERKKDINRKTSELRKWQKVLPLAERAWEMAKDYQRRQVEEAG